MKSPKWSWWAVDLGYAYAVEGYRAEATKILAKLKEEHERDLVPSASIAIPEGALGDFDGAFVWLNRAFDERDPELTYLKVPGRRFEPLRHDPRYQQLVDRMHFPK